MKLLNTPIIFNFWRPITFICNNISISFIEKNYTLEEILATLSPITSLEFNPINNKLFSNVMMNFRFYTRDDRNYILTFLGFNNFLDLQEIRDLNVSIEGIAKYSLNVQFNTIIKLRLGLSGPNAETPAEAFLFLESGAFSNSNIINVPFNTSGSFDFYNIYCNQIVKPINNVILVSDVSPSASAGQVSLYIN